MGGDGLAGDEHPLGYLWIREAFGDQLHDLELGRRETLPPGRRPLALTASPAGVLDSLVEREAAALGVGVLERVVAHGRPQAVHCRVAPRPVREGTDSP